MPRSQTRSLTPVFLLAPMNRSGTKLFKSVLLAHPRITQGFSLEDYSLAYSDTLIQFADAISRHWARTQEEKALHRDRLIDGIGPFLLDFFTEGADLKTADHLLLTTPRPWGISNVFRLFPSARLIVLIRNGGDTVESARNSFPGPSFGQWVREWDKGAQEVLRFANAERESGGRRWQAVSFEKLVRDPESVGRTTFGFLGLDGDAVDWDAVREGPVRGSSEHGGPAHNRPKTADFNPVGRSSGWSWLERAQFRRRAEATDKALKQLLDRAVDRTPPAPARHEPRR